MAHFLRDQNIANITVDKVAIKQLCTLFSNKLDLLNINLQKHEGTSLPKDDGTGKIAFLTYIIRCDGKGFRVFNINDLMEYFHSANNIERIIFTLETGESIQASRRFGTCMELILDQSNPNGCFLMVTANDRDWVDASFLATKEILNNCKNHNGWIRTAWTRLLIQISGVTFGFVFSFWAANKISQKLTIENSLIICFLFFLMIFSNTWSFFSEQIFIQVNNTFPSLKIYRPAKDRIHWIMQAIIGSIAFAVTWRIISIALTFIGGILNGFVK